MKKITVQDLIDHGACEGQRRQFEANFPQGLEVSQVGLQQARAVGLEIWWAKQLLSTGQKAAFQVFVNAAKQSLSEAQRLVTAERELAYGASLDAYNEALRCNRAGYDHEQQQQQQRIADACKAAIAAAELQLNRTCSEADFGVKQGRYSRAGAMQRKLRAKQQRKLRAKQQRNDDCAAAESAAKAAVNRAYELLQQRDSQALDKCRADIKPASAAANEAFVELNRQYEDLCANALLLCLRAN